ncbi:hypothetical protein SCRDD08_00440 [Streptococcus cristatus]|uniref:Uncharacterized protein n=1 Tax=Streptococcus cristatus TaxID=45634 RepID=A0A139N3V3_STRCR|nr:hypothetical protein SCRDD08_00440 [Streptococcus cristatus]
MMRIPEEIRKKLKKEVAATRAWCLYLSKTMRVKYLENKDLS